jgi:carboxyl-terminal processing protease
MNRGFKYGVVTLSTVLVGFLLIGVVLGQSAPPGGNEPYRHLNVFTEVFAKIKAEYVEEPDMKNVTLGAINGLLVSMDPFSSYLNKEQYEAYQKARQTPKANLGLILSRKYGFEMGVVHAIEGSPADQMGLTTGDIIEAINGISTRDMPLAFAEVLLSGEPGSTIELTVLRLRRPEPTTVKLTRAMVTPPGAATKMIDTATGHVQVRTLTAGSAAQVAQKIRDLEKQGARRLVLDLRNCAVSEPAEGILLADLFLDSGKIATLEGQRVAKETFEASSAKTVWKGPLVVLTNRGTAGAAEIAATALLDNKRAQVVGERSYGDAALRKEIATQDGGAVLLAVAKYYSPGGKAIQDVSVTPTHAVVDSTASDSAGLDDDPEAAPLPGTPAPPPSATPAPTEDKILEKAIEVLAGKAGAANQEAAQAVAPQLLPRIGQPQAARP